MGTKTVYTPDVLAKVEELATLGYTLREIERAIGLKEDSLTVLKSQSKAKDDLRVLNVFTCARENFLHMHQENIRNQSDKDWRASKYLLSVRDPEHFSERRQVELSGNVKMKISAEDREKLAKMSGK